MLGLPNGENLTDGGRSGTHIGKVRVDAKKLSSGAQFTNNFF
jgi:hypothetical protein